MKVARLIAVFILLAVGSISVRSQGVEVEYSRFVAKEPVPLGEIHEYLDKFTPAELRSLGNSSPQGELWIRADVRNTTDRDIEGYIELGNPALCPQFFSVTPSKGDSGWRLTELEGETSLSRYVTASFPVGEVETFLIRIPSRGAPVKIYLRILPKADFYKKERRTIGIVSFMSGVMLLLLLAAIAACFIGQSRYRLWLLLYFVGLSMSLIINGRMTMILFGVDYSLGLETLRQMLVFIYSASLLNYILSEVGIDKIRPELWHPFRLTAFLVAAASLLVPFVNILITTVLAKMAITVCWAVMLYTCDTGTKSGCRDFRALSTGLIVFYLAYIVAMLYDYAQLPVTDFTVMIPSLPHAIFIVFLLVYVAQRIGFESKKLHKLNHKLDHLVNERTVEVQSQNAELRAQSDEITARHEELQAQAALLESQKEELESQKEMLESQNVDLERLRLVASNTDNIIYIFTPEGVLLWFNNSLTSLLGLNYDEFVSCGREITIEAVSTNPDIMALLRSCVVARTPCSYESRVVNTLGMESWFQTTLTPICEEAEVKYVVAIDTNISVLKRYEVELESQRNIAIGRRVELESRQAELTDSLRYAQHIQHAILPQVRDIQRFFPESFVFYRPKDIVSGDFYWFHCVGDRYVFAAVDCTGHGVPGAFMSIIGIYLLNSIIIQNGETRPAEILKQLNRKLKISLKNDNSERPTNDGMDAAVVTLDSKSGKLYFAGAIRPLFLCAGGDFVEVKGDKIPITSEIMGNMIAKYKEWEFDVVPGDRFYIFSDGIVDQFGGDDNKKFLTKRFKQLVLDAQGFPMEQQARYIREANSAWRGSNPQVDDILVMGVQI